MFSLLKRGFTGSDISVATMLVSSFSDSQVKLLFCLGKSTMNPYLWDLICFVFCFVFTFSCIVLFSHLLQHFVTICFQMLLFYNSVFIASYNMTASCNTGPRSVFLLLHYNILYLSYRRRLTYNRITNFGGTQAMYTTFEKLQYGDRCAWMVN